MGSWAEGDATGAVFGGDALAVWNGPDALRADTRGDVLAVWNGPDALRADQRGDALAVAAGPDALALPEPGTDPLGRSVVAGDDPLTGYGDATLLLGGVPSPAAGRRADGRRAGGDGRPGPSGAG
ncbi:MAG: hypothetical protein AVDCRST_MAG41-788, partial [uncultured Corynebacteriales bacterium]